MNVPPDTIMALDIGSKRIGVALTTMIARLPQPLTTIKTKSAIAEIKSLIEEHQVKVLVVGVPRGINGETTEQTKQTLLFIKELRDNIEVVIHEQDEAITSLQAESELSARGKNYAKSDIDALAATYILEDYINAR